MVVVEEWMGGKAGHLLVSQRERESVQFNLEGPVGLV